MKTVKKSIKLGGRSLTLSKSSLAAQADSAVLATYGETVVLATVVASTLTEDRGYFPLGVEYQERLYAGGRIKGSRWVKREGRPSDDEILTARLIDRSIRPLFPKSYKKDVQVIITVLSVDLENDPSLVAPVAVSAALATSPIPWDGPIGVVKVGMKDGSFFTNPLDSEQVYSDLGLIVSSTAKAIVMIEAEAKEVPEEQILKGLEYAQGETSKIIDFINEFASEFDVKKEVFKEEKASPELIREVKKLVRDSLPDVITRTAQKESGDEGLEELRAAVADLVTEEERAKAVSVLEELYKNEVKAMILKGKRPDGRAPDQVRPLSSQVGVLPRTHGSAIFQRGLTQTLTVTTLGSPSLGQLIESAEGEEEKRYIHHYSMPPYSIGETGRVGYPSRREIGHGALAERALMPVIPSEEVFPYTVRVVSEILSSNGSTSMAATCGSTLSLMDAGVPISSPVAGIAMGLVIKDEKKFSVLSDIAGIEDFNGDMDFKIAGSKKGVTAIQLDVKTLNLTLPILKEALSQARVGREEIMKSIVSAIDRPREAVSTYAPKIKSFKIDPEKIGEVIGPGGKVIKKIIAETEAQVEVEDDGTVNVSGMSADAVKRAKEWVESIVKEVAPGEIYKGEVKRIQPFGAFVEILPGKEGLVHISDMAESFVTNPEDVVKVGDKTDVRVKEIDKMGRLNLSMILDPAKEKKEDRRGPRRQPSRRRPSHRQRSSGPSFPASRLVKLERKNPQRRFGR